jgi:hypothetical protein
MRSDCKKVPFVWFVPLLITIFLVLMAKLHLGAALTDTQARAQAIATYGPTGCIRKSTGPTTSWRYEVGTCDKYGFTPKTVPASSWVNAFAAKPPVSIPMVAKRSGRNFDRINLRVVPTIITADVFATKAQNEKTNAEAESHLTQFIELVCAKAPLACSLKGEELGVSLTKVAP